MRTALHRLPAILTGVVVTAVASCAPGDPEPEDGPPDALPAAEAARALELGAPAADALVQGLVSRLTGVMGEAGTVAALEFCSEEALPLTAQIQDELADPLDVKRTTLRWRNPENAPDPWEERILRYLAELEELDPDAVPAELTGEGPDGSLRYYRVLRVAPMCLTCHGADDAVDAEVREVIQGRYPDDRAVGYEAGELRGVVRVEIPAAEDR